MSETVWETVNQPPDAGLKDEQLLKLIGQRPLMRAASELLSLLIPLREMKEHPRREDLLYRLGPKVEEFHRAGLEAGVRERFVDYCRYAICAALDEAIMSTVWGQQCGWAGDQLQGRFYQGAMGGSQFFQVLADLEKGLPESLPAIEIFYYCIAYGFRGQYGVSREGMEELELERMRLYDLLTRHLGLHDDEPLSAHVDPLPVPGRRIREYIPTWVAAAAAGAVLVVSFAMLRWWLSAAAAPQLDVLQGIQDSEDLQALTEPRVVQRAAVSDPLAAMGELDGDRIRVDLAGVNFASGRADLKPEALTQIDRIATPLIRQPQRRVLIKGHTDSLGNDATNLALSRDRAEAVGRRLVAQGVDRAQLEIVGVGSAEPRASNESARGRARNRRVELFIDRLPE